MSACCHPDRKEAKLGLITKKGLGSLLGPTEGLEPTKGLLQACPTERNLQLNADKVVPFPACEQPWGLASALSWHGHGHTKDGFSEV